MMEDIRVLLVTKDPEVEEQVARACRESSDLVLVGTVARVDEAASVAHQRHARVILLDSSVLDNLEEVILNVTLAAADCFIFALVPQDDLDMAQRTLLAGARGFIFKPVDAEALARTITRVITLDSLRHAEADKEKKRGKGVVVTVLGAKGGIGRTVVAANLAVALHKQTKARVLVMEAMNLPGDLAAVFAVAPQFGLLDILAAGSDIDLTSLEDLIPQHPSGVYVLPAVLDYEGQPIDANRLRGFLRLARQMFEYIVVDTGELQDPFTEVVVEEADRVLLLTSPDLLALHRTVKFYNALTENLKTSEEAIVLVFNMDGLRGGVRKSAVEQLLGVKIQYTITYDPDTVMESIRKGNPFVVVSARSQVAQDIERLANVFAARGDTPSGGLRPTTTSSLLERMRALLSVGLQPAALTANLIRA